MAATYDEVVDALLNNADFEESGSVSKARAFITAATRYFILQPASASDQNSSMAMGLTQIQDLMARATAFVRTANATTAATSQVRYLTAAEGFRR